MHRSPHELRSGSKGKPVSLSVTDKRKVKRSVSTSSAPSTSELNLSTMPGPADKPSIDVTLIEKCVDRYFSGGEVFKTLISKLTEDIKSAVETAVANALVTVHLEMKKLRDEVSSLAKRLGELDERLEDKNDELEQYQRRVNLRIFGVEEKNGEDTDQLVIDICRDRLGQDISLDQISRSHRVGKPPRSEMTPDSRKPSRPIIVRFCSYRDRRRVFDSKKKLKGTGYSIREDLTARRVEVLRQVTATYGVRNTWTQDGRVLWVDQRGGRGMAARLADLKERMAAGTSLTKN